MPGPEVIHAPFVQVSSEIQGYFPQSVRPKKRAMDHSQNSPNIDPERLFCVDDYPELSLLVWNRVAGQRMVTAEEAFSLYRSYWRFVDQDQMPPHEREFFDQLVEIYGNGLFVPKRPWFQSGDD